MLANRLPDVPPVPPFLPLPGRRAVLAAVALGAGAQPGDALAATPPDLPELKLGGTGAGLAAARLLAGLCRSAADPFELIIVMGLGSAGGVAAAAAGAVDVALSASVLTATDLAAGARGHGELARTPMAFVVARNSTATDVTTDELLRIYGGSMLSWADDTPIRLVRRPPNDSEWWLLAGLDPRMAAAMDAAQRRRGLPTTGNDNENADLMEQLPGALGFMSLGQLMAEGRELRPLRVDGEVPTAGGSNRASNFAKKPFYLVTARHPSRRAEAFLALLAQPAAREVLSAHGFVPPGGPVAGARP